MTIDTLIHMSNLRRWLIVLTFVCSLQFIIEESLAAEPELSIANVSAIALKAKYTELNEQLLNNQFQRELHLISTESSNNLKGEIYAVVDYPFASASRALNNPNHWCDALILHVNIKYCHASGDEPNTILKVNLGKKFEQPLAQTYGVEFNYREVMKTTDYFAVELKAANGPLSTHDYRIWIEATPLIDGRTFLHFTYTYAFGFAGRVAMQGYLATGARNKVGFTTDGKLPDGQPDYIKGVRGVVERNTMRYYLAIDAYLAALTSPASKQLEKRLQQWYKSTEQYTVQLHEVERNDYLDMKRKEYQRQQVAQ
ncbi:MAG: hypothetical protein ABL880_03475 [Methylotenera sp.]